MLESGPGRARCMTGILRVTDAGDLDGVAAFGLCSKEEAVVAAAKTEVRARGLELLTSPEGLAR